MVPPRYKREGVDLNDRRLFFLCLNRYIQCYYLELMNLRRRSNIYTKENLIGKVVGDLEVIEFSDRKKNKELAVICKCTICGKVDERTVRTLLKRKGKICCKYCKESWSKIHHENSVVEARSAGRRDPSKNYKNNTSGRKGVHFDKIRHRWVASIKYKKHHVTLGTSLNFNIAVQMREEAEEAIESGTFEQYIFDLKGIRI